MGLSKSRFLSGMQCAKKLYLDVHKTELKPLPTAAQQSLFDAGHEVGMLAQSFYPNGLDASAVGDKTLNTAINKTKQWINEGVTTIYEATFSHCGVLSALDILHNENGKKVAIEVKSSTEVKDYYYIDAAVQYWVMSGAGYTPDEIRIMYINKNYRKNGDIDLQEFFQLEDVTERVKAMQDQIGANINDLSVMLKKPDEPSVAIGKQCDKPFECGYKQYCWAHIPEHSVFDLYKAGNKAWELYASGIVKLADIPESVKLSKKQTIQVEGAKNGTSFINTKELQAFVKVLKYPLYFLDFETIAPAVPMFNGTRPYQQLPFQYSLHVTDEAGNIIKHSEFLAQPEDFRDTVCPKDDPRYKLLMQLKADIGNEGSIVVYNISFERDRLKELGVAFPSEAGYIKKWIESMVDLLVPFSKGWYYLPEMNGSASIKKVLPSIAPGFSYKDLAIGNGGDASALYMSMIKDIFTGSRETTMHNMLEYCKRDTEGMVILFNELLKNVNMFNFTNCVLKNLLAASTPPCVADLLIAYFPGHPDEALKDDLYAEPYYGDFNSCSAVLLTHNPGDSTHRLKGIGSAFETIIDVNVPPLTRADNYHRMAVTNTFPNPKTNVWVNDRNREINNLFGNNFSNRVFIRDLVPYHSARFGEFHFNLASTFLHREFFPQVFDATLNSELYNRLKAKLENSAPLIITARGGIWKEINGLSSVGWSLIGHVYSNLYIYKLDSNKFKKTKGFDDTLYIKDILEKDIFIFVVTPQKGGRVNIYKRYRNNGGWLERVFTLQEVVNNYRDIVNVTDQLYITRTDALTDLFDRLALL